MKKLIMCFSLLLLMSCASKQKSVKTAESSPIKEEKPLEINTNNLTEIAKAVKRIEEDPNLSDITKRLGSLPDSVFAGIERTACYGRCPVYKVNIYKSGYTIWEGIRNTDKEGIHIAKLTPQDLMTISKKWEEILYFNFNNIYDKGATDLPNTYTWANNSTTKKVILSRQEVPEKLRAYELWLEELLAKQLWVRR